MMHDNTLLVPQHKKAFSMITAVMTIVIMATVTAMIMSISGKTLKATTEQYQKEQAALLARSYTEMAILYVTGYDRTLRGDCLTQINSKFGQDGNQYAITTQISYIGNDTLLPAGCTSAILRWPTTTNAGFDATVSLVVDVYVEYADFDDPSSGRTRTFHRRTLQKL